MGWRSVGDEDRHAAFFLTIADEKNKPEFCKSDPRRRRVGVRRGISQSTRVLPPSTELLPRSGRSFLVALALSSPSRSRLEQQAGAPFSSTPFLPPIRSLTQHSLSQHIPCPRRGGVRER